MTSPLWTATDVLAATAGQGSQAWSCNGLSIDSRTAKAGDLFIALKGPAFDGHDFVADALAKGAVAALVHRKPDRLPTQAQIVTVPDTMQALQDLGRFGRARTQATIIGVTGSVGKTGTKEMLRIALAAQGQTFATQGSFNNHWGVPLSLAQLPADAAYGVFELGMNHAGEIAVLTKQVQPHISLITAVEAVHLEFFKSVEGIADAKAEIFLGQNVDGAAILPRDNPHYARLLAHARTQGLQKIMSFGRDSKADGVLLECKQLEAESAVTACIHGKIITYTLGTPGIHLAMNSLGALLAAEAAGASLATSAAALVNYVPPDGRGQRKTISLGKGGNITLIDETYNASPVAVAAAINLLGQVKPSATGRRIAVLGDMRELGPTAPQLHAELAGPIKAAQVDLVFCCGHHMQALYEALPQDKRGAYTADSAQLAALLPGQVKAGDVVMIKGSKSIHMELVVQALQKSSST